MCGFYRGYVAVISGMYTGAIMGLCSGLCGSSFIGAPVGHIFYAGNMNWLWTGNGIRVKYNVQLAPQTANLKLQGPLSRSALQGNFSTACTAELLGNIVEHMYLYLLFVVAKPGRKTVGLFLAAARSSLTVMPKKRTA